MNCNKMGLDVRARLAAGRIGTGFRGGFLAGIAFLAALLCLGAVPMLQAQTGLVAAYNFNEDTGTVVHDLSGNGYNGTAVSTTWAAGKNSFALAFNGSTGHVDLGTPAAFASTGSMTWEAWVYITARTADDGNIIALANDALGWQLKTSHDTGVWTFGVAVSNGTSHIQRYSHTVPALATWYHVAAVYNAAAQTLDIYTNGALDDGVLSGTVPAAQVLPAGVHTLMGERTGACPCAYAGRIDDLRVYNVPLAQTQIAADMNTPVGGPAAPTAPALNITSTSATQVGLNWTASTSTVGILNYQLQRCTGAGCGSVPANFATIQTQTTLTYADTMVAANTSYSYRVIAYDLNSTPSQPSNVVTTVTQQAPTAPVLSTPTVITTPTGISLGWTASTSAVGLANYLLERCNGIGCSNFAQIASLPTTPLTYTDTPLTASNSYSYRMRAVDTSSNMGPYSNTVSATTNAIPGTITFIQGNYAVPTGLQTSVPVTFLGAQTAGDLNVIVVGWNDSTATVNTVTDSNNNIYTLAVGPTSVSGVATQSIYFSAGIAASPSNTVTVTFTGSGASYPDIRILEYAGAATSSPVDVTAVGTGTGLTSSTSAVQTNNAADLLFGANIVATATVTPGINFVQRILTTPDADIAEDEMVTSVGSYSASAFLDPAEAAGAWVMQMVAFRAATGAGGTQPPTAPILSGSAFSTSQINLSWTPATSTIGIQNYVLRRCQGTGCASIPANFATIASPTAATFTYNDMNLATGTSYSYQVYGMDTQNNLGAVSNTFTISTLGAGPNITGLSPSSGTVGTPIVIAGTGFGATQSTSTVTFNGIAATPTIWSATSITVPVPVGAISGSVVVTVNSVASNAMPFSLTVNISVVQSQNRDTSTNQTSITVPITTTAGNLLVAWCGEGLNITDAFTISDSASNFWTLVNRVNRGTTGRNALFYTANAASVSSVSCNFTTAGGVYHPRLMVWEIAGAATSSPLDSSVTASNTSLGTSCGSGSMTTTNANDILILACDVSNNQTGAFYTAASPYTIPVNGAAVRLGMESQIVSALQTGVSASMTYPVASTSDNIFAAFKGAGVVAPPPTPTITTLLPISGPVGTPVTITGTNFGATQSTSTVTFNGTAATPTTWTASSIVVPVPTGATSGLVVVTVGGVPSNGATFTVTTPAGPGAPTSVMPAPVSNTQINLSWTAPTNVGAGIKNYVIQRCAGAGCTNFATVGSTVSSTPTTYSDTPLLAGTTYLYRIATVDTSNNTSPFSTPAASATTLGVSAPVLTATPVSSSQINLSWTPSYSSNGIKNYVLQSCSGVGCNNFSTINSPMGTATTYSNSSLSASTSYSYQISAVDNSNNTSLNSNIATTSTLPVSTAALIAAYGFEEGSGGLTFDASGNGFTGTLNAGVNWTTSGKYGNALVFDGGSGFVDLGAPAQMGFTGSMSWEAWIYATKLPQGNGSLSDNMIIAMASDASGWELKLTTDTGAVTAAIAVSNGSARIQRYSKTVFKANTWYHVAGVYNARAQTLDFYTNGVLDDGALSGTVPSAQVIPSGVNANIGRRVTSPSNLGGFFFGGTIDEVRMYDSAITATQIQADMNAPVGGGGHPTVSFNQPNLSFGNQLINTSSSQQVVTLTNTGNAPLSITSIGISESGPLSYTQTNNCGSTLAPSSAPCQITVVFTPSATGSLPASVTVVDNAPGSPHTVPLTGTGMLSNTALFVSPRSIPLTAGRTQQFTAYNGAAVTWSVDGIPGGSSAVGTITANGLYTAPASIATQTTHTVTATGATAANATVYLVNWTGTFTRDVDTLRTGLNPNEVVLTPSNVNSSTFGKVFSYPIDGHADASPLYVPNVNIGGNIHNVVYVATEHNSVFAFDADGTQTTPLWQVSFINPSAGITTIPALDVGGCSNNVCDIGPEIGITGTPVIDPSTNTLYVVAMTKEVNSPNIYYHRLHALDITNGTEKFGGPVIISASVPGTGAGSSGGVVSFYSLRHNQRPALLLSNGVVYVSFASHNDYVPYHGWILGYQAAQGLKQTLVYNTSPNATSFGAGIWMSGDGLATDSTGNIFFVTGNGIFDANTGGVDYGDSLMSINPTTGHVNTYFTPADQINDNANDLDLGSGGVLLVPAQAGSAAHPSLALTAGKDGTLYLVDRTNMGGYNSSNNNQIVQTLQNEFPGGTYHTGNFKAPVWWNGNLYYSADADNVRSFSISNAQITVGPKNSLIFNYPGGTLGVSSNGNSTPILWAIQRIDLDPLGNGTVAPGVLHAFDATNVATELYNSNQASASRDMLDHTNKWSAPLPANGRVYVASEGFLTAFGLLP